MANTLLKAVSDKIVKACRLCNKELELESHPVDLYGLKSNREGILKCLQEFTNNVIHKDDGLSKKLCRSCVNKLTTYNNKREEIQYLLLATEAANRSSNEGERFKRGRRENENVSSPSAALQVSKKSKLIKPSTPRKLVTLAPKFSNNNRRRGAFHVIKNEW